MKVTRVFWGISRKNSWSRVRRGPAPRRDSFKVPSGAANREEFVRTGWNSLYGCLCIKRPLD